MSLTHASNVDLTKQRSCCDREGKKAFVNHPRISGNGDHRTISKSGPSTEPCGTPRSN